MKKYTVAAVPGGYAVAYAHCHLGSVIHTEFSDRRAAEREAARLEMQHQAEQARAALSKSQHRQLAISHAERRTVRWLEPDAFA